MERRQMKRTTHVGLCRLCLANGSVLMDSHILPEFTYRPIYNAKGRAVAIDPKRRVQQYTVQQGPREYLLCAHCESAFSRLETYSAGVLRNIPATTGTSPGGRIAIPGVDYTRFKLFQLSMLWRASVATHAWFAAVKLADQHEETLRQMLFTETPGEPHEYGCVLGTIVRPNSLHTLTRSPFEFLMEGHPAIQFIVCGLFWLSPLFPDPLAFPGTNEFLTRAGDLKIVISSKSQEEILRGALEQMQEDGVVL